MGAALVERVVRGFNMAVDITVGCGGTAESSVVMSSRQWELVTLGEGSS